MSESGFVATFTFGRVIADALKRSASKDTTREVITCFKLDSEDGVKRVIATDTHRLFWADLDGMPNPGVPPGAPDGCYSLMGPTKDGLVATHKPDLQYPNWRRVVPVSVDMVWIGSLYTNRSKGILCYDCSLDMELLPQARTPWDIYRNPTRTKSPYLFIARYEPFGYIQMPMQLDDNRPGGFADKDTPFSCLWRREHGEEVKPFFPNGRPLGRDLPKALAAPPKEEVKELEAVPA